MKQELYENKFGHIPIDFNERLEWMYDNLGVTESQTADIINRRDDMIYQLRYYTINLILFQLPEGTPRPRFRLVNRSNFVDCASTNSQFVHVYNPYAREDSVFMNRLLGSELKSLETLICTPIRVTYNTFLQTPKSLSTPDKFMAEIGIIRPTTKPDFDNLAKKYSDMSNHNLWLDDSFVISGHVELYYSMLPRIEITIEYLNMLYNRYQYNSISNRKDYIKYNCDTEYYKYIGG